MIKNNLKFVTKFCDSIYGALKWLEGLTSSWDKKLGCFVEKSFHIYFSKRPNLNLFDVWQLTSFDDTSSLFLASLAEELRGGEFIDPSCIDKKYFVAAWRSCSRSSAVCRLINILNIWSWSSLVGLHEGPYHHNSQANLVAVLHALSLLLCNFINTTARYHLGRCDPSSPSNKELLGLVKELLNTYIDH